MRPAAKKSKSTVSLQLDIENFLKNNEKGDSELFAQLFKDQVIYDHSTKEWYLWHGQFWEPDNKREIIGYVSNRVAAEYIQQAATERANNGPTTFYEMLIERGKHLRSLVRTKHVLEYSTSEPEISLSGSEWDNNRDLFPVNNCVIELETGNGRNALPGEYIRYHSPVDYKGLNEPCPLWEKTLNGIFDGDYEMIAFIQRLFGYAITGHVTEHKLPIFLGESARNGKTTIFETLHNVLGEDFSTAIPMNVFMKKKYINDGPAPYLVKLKSKRLAYSSESAEGIKIDTALIKFLTGGDTMNPRGLYEKTPNSFNPTHKLMLFTNYQPAVPADDQATWDRILLIELGLRFVENPVKPNERKRDKDLSEKLKSEYSGILAWLVRGNLEWRKQGLNPPDKVLKSTSAYRDAEDILQLFIDEALTFGPNFSVMAHDLYMRYRNWATSYGMNPITLTAFGKKIKTKIGESQRHPSGNGKFYPGVKI